MSDADDGLLARAVEGDTDALAELLRVHGPNVERSLRIDRVWQSVLEPADVMQVTYLEAFIRIRSFKLDRQGTFEGWLRTIAENNLRDAIRGLSRQKQPQPQARVRPASYEDSLVGLYDLLGVTSTTPSRQVRQQEACQLLQSTIDALPDDYARIIRLYDLESRPIAEVAQEMGRTPGAVHMLRARAHDRLREALGTESKFFSTGA